ncbi:MAG: 50S ribosome-binding GTPase, partial [bacterium]|nr:50S ribosome-binding GTPase [bacterium]
MIRELNTGEEQLHSYLRIVDLLIEVRDARVPASCEDPLFERLASRRERVLVLSQADLACPDTTARWCMVLGKQGYPVFHMDLKHGTGLGVLKNYFKRFPGKRSRRSRRRSLPGGSQPLRAMVIGVPNTGKSSLINRLAGHRRARV